MTIPKDFINYWRGKGGRLRTPNKRPIMTLEEMWAMWEPYWHLRYDHHHNVKCYPKYVLGRYGDKGDYTVDNCRVITIRENTLERDHSKCRDKLIGKVQNPRGGATVKHRNERVVTPKGEFKDCVEAAEAYGMHRSSMWHRVNSDRYPGFHWR